MFLYVSTGFDAEIIRRFKRRRGQWKNIAEHIKNGAVLGFKIWWQRIRKLWQEDAGFGHAIEDDGGYHLTSIRDRKYHKGTAIDILNTPTISSGGFVWGRPGGNRSEHGVPFRPARMNDGRVEVLTSPHPVNTATGVLFTQLSRLAQATAFDLNFIADNDGRPFQVDGECMVCFGGGLMQVRYGGQIPMLRGEQQRYLQDTITPLADGEELPPVAPMRLEYETFNFPGQEHMFGE
jgi:hypothetical protein